MGEEVIHAAGWAASGSRRAATVGTLLRRLRGLLGVGVTWGTLRGAIGAGIRHRRRHGDDRCAGGLKPSHLATALVLLGLASAQGLRGQELRGRIVDASNGEPVGLAGVFILSSERDVVVGAASDTAGFYRISAPDAGEYFLYVQRLGYFENESPLLALEAGGTYGVDMEMRPEPFRLDPLEVTVRNEELEQYLTLELGMNPNSIFGYRAIQGVRLQEAKLRAADNTDLLRELYIPVSHGFDVCVGSIGMGLPERGSGDAGGERRCGSLYLDDIRCQNEHIEEIPMDAIAVVVVLGGNVRLYTRQFDWTFRPVGRVGVC